MATRTRNRNSKKTATFTVAEGTETTTGGTVNTWTHNNSHGGFDRVCTEAKAWVGFTKEDGHVGMDDFEQDEEDEFGRTSRWAFVSRKTGRRVEVTVRSAFKTN